MDMRLQEIIEFAEEKPAITEQYYAENKELS